MFVYQTVNDIEWLSFCNDNKFLAGVSTRNGGFSIGEYSSMNLGINTQDNPEIVAKNRSHFFNNVAPEFEVFYLNQTHSADIYNIDSNVFLNFTAGDGLYTTQRKKLLSITIADCGSVILIDKNLGFCGAVHCGWRGTQQGIVTKLCNLAKEYTDLHNLQAFMGPMIMPQNYEVGEEFASYFGSSYFIFKNGKRFFNLNKAIENSLQDAGIMHIKNTQLDTYTENARFFSHRRNQNAGRMCAFVGMK